MVRSLICAQRLSASQGATHTTHRSLRTLSNVLNAFRHHRVLRAGMKLHRTANGGAQRLSASQGATPRSTRFTCCWFPSAQRLSASQGATPTWRWAGPSDRAWCSTPFGITGCYARRRPDGRSGLYRVLNAFRHHRVLRAAATEEDEMEQTCSTPFGITGCYAKLREVVVAQRVVCSTPFGITGCYAKLREVVVAQRVVCSTPFGITGCYAGLLSSHGHPLRSAQRLSASQGATRSESSCSVVGDLFVLNAFRHHRVLRTKTT